MGRLVEQTKIIAARAPIDCTGAAMTDKYVSLKDYNHLTIIIKTGTWAGGNSAVTLKQATAVAGTGTKALAFSYMWTDSTTAGTLVKTAVTSNTFNVGTAARVYVIEVDASSLDVANDFDCVSLALASPGANADLVDATYILSEPRFAQSTPPTGLLD